MYLAGEKADGTHEEAKYLLGQDYLPLHALVHIDKRSYRIEQVNYSQDTVVLQDADHPGESGFPYARTESIEFVRSYLEEEPGFPIITEALEQPPISEKQTAEADKNVDSSLPDQPIAKPAASAEPPLPRMMETVVELTDQGYQVTETRPVREYQYDCMFHDIAYLDGQAYQVEKIGLFDVTFQPLETENIYPVARVESMERLETLLAQDDRNSHLLRTSTLEQRQQVIDSWKQKTAQYKISQQNDVFEFQGYHFEPVGVFSQEMSFSDISRGTVSHTELDMTDAPDALHPYSHTRFYDAAHDVKCSGAWRPANSICREIMNFLSMLGIMSLFYSKRNHLIHPLSEKLMKTRTREQASRLPLKTSVSLTTTWARAGPKPSSEITWRPSIP